MKKVLLGVAALGASVAASFLYCGGEVDQPPTTTETTAGGVPVVNGNESPQAEAKSTSTVDAGPQVPFHANPPPLLEVQSVPTGPAPVCTSCPKEAPRAPLPPETR